MTPEQQELKAILDSFVDATTEQKLAALEHAFRISLSVHGNAAIGDGKLLKMLLPLLKELLPLLLAILTKS